MISGKVQQWVEPINKFIFRHIYLLGVFLCVIILTYFINRIRNHFIKKRADNVEVINTNEWFKIDKED